MSKKTVAAIISSGNEYLIGLKANQPKLYSYAHALAATQLPIDCDDRSNHGHGRHERRIVSVWDCPRASAIADDARHDLPDYDPAWVGLQRIIRVERFRRRHGEPASADSYECRYYITSRSGDTAFRLAGMIRQHWQIENALHWVKDVQQHEDTNGIRGANAPENLSLLKTWVLTLFRINGHRSIKAATIAFANKINDLSSLMRT